MPLQLAFFTQPVAAVLAGYPNLVLPLLRSRLRASPLLDNLARQPSAHLFPGAQEPECAHCGLLLILGGWEQSHKMSQDIARPEGSYWHAIAHRIEPDASNSRYWFRRVGVHAVFEPLREGAAAIIQTGRNAPQWKVPDPWDPFAFTNFCEQAVAENQGAAHHPAASIQSLEWRLLFEWCARPADH